MKNSSYPLPSETLQILIDHLGYPKQSSKNSGHDNKIFKCPFCNHYKHKLEIDINDEYWHCWVCNVKGRGIYFLLKKLRADGSIIKRYRRNFKTEKKTVEKQEEVVNLPKEFIPLWEDRPGLHSELVNRYLKSRGVSTEDIIRYRLGYCDSGKHTDMIIFPSYDRIGKLNYYVGRSFRSWAKSKYTGPSTKKDFVGFELFISWNDPVVIVEGPLDAITVRRNVIPLFGKTLSKKLKQEIIEKHPPKLYLALDPDATKDLIQHCEFFNDRGIETYIVDLKDGDPNEIGYDQFWKLVETASKVRSVDTFKEKIRLML